MAKVARTSALMCTFKWPYVHIANSFFLLKVYLLHKFLRDLLYNFAYYVQSLHNEFYLHIIRNDNNRPKNQTLKPAKNAGIWMGNEIYNQRLSIS